MIAKIGFVLFSNLLSGRFLAVLGIGRIVLNAQFAYVQFSIACLANIQAPKRKSKRSKGCTTPPADQGMGHEIIKLNDRNFGGM